MFLMCQRGGGGEGHWPCCCVCHTTVLGSICINGPNGFDTLVFRDIVLHSNTAPIAPIQKETGENNLGKFGVTLHQTEATGFALYVHLQYVFIDGAFFFLANARATLRSFPCRRMRR